MTFNSKNLSTLFTTSICHINAIFFKMESDLYVWGSFTSFLDHHPLLCFLEAISTIFYSSFLSSLPPYCYHSSSTSLFTISIFNNAHISIQTSNSCYVYLLISRECKSKDEPYSVCVLFKFVFVLLYLQFEVQIIFQM